MTTSHPTGLRQCEHKQPAGFTAFLVTILLIVSSTVAHAGIKVETTGDDGAEVAVFTTSTVVDLPGGASTTNTLEIQCSAGEILYVVVDFATPRLSKRTRTLDTRLTERVAGKEEALRTAWRLHFDALSWREEPPADHEKLRNLQLNRMVLEGDEGAWVSRLLQAPYLSIEQPARGERSFLFELSHVAGELQRLRPHCGL